jgi:hypothetical protein
MTTTPTLKQSFIKIRRAKKHIADLEQAFELYLEKTPPRFTAENRKINDRNVIYFEMRSEPFQEEVPAIFGDAIHNMRAALDIAAVGCVKANNKNDNNVHFPFCENATDLDRVIMDKNLHRAHADVVDYVKSLAPYKGGNIALRAMHDLDILDKHRAMIPQTISVSSPILELHDGNGNYYDPPRIVGCRNTPSEIKFVFPDESPFAKEEIIPTLHKLAGLTDGIVTAVFIFIRIHYAFLCFETRLHT